MKALMLHIGASFILCLASGCGTLMTLGQNSQHPPQVRRYVYSGIRSDLTAMGRQGTLPTPRWAQLLFLVDLPLSACMDTLCLPYTLPMARINQKTIAEAPKRITEIPEELEATAQVTFDSGKTYFIWTPATQPVVGHRKNNHSSATVPVKWAVRSITPESFDKATFKLKSKVTAVDDAGREIEYSGPTHGPLRIWAATDSFKVTVHPGGSKRATATIWLIATDVFQPEPISNVLEVQIDFQDQ